MEALCRSCDARLSDEQSARALTAVEPSDCVHFPGIAHVSHLSGEADTLHFDRERICRDVGGPIVTPVPNFGRWTDLPIELNIPIHFIARRKERGFRIHVEEMAETVARHKATVAVICNPDNPTGASTTFPSAANFLYCELGPGHSGPALRTRLPEDHGILARECGNKLGSTQAHLRFAVLPKGATDRLGTALEECLGAAGGASYSGAVGRMAASAGGGS